jgi:TolB protein
MIKRFRVCILLCLLLATSIATAAPSEVILGTTKEAWDKIDILVSPLEVASGGQQAQNDAWILESIMRVDFDYSGLFRAVESDALADSTTVTYAVEGLLEGRLPGTAVTAEEAAPLLTLKLMAYPGRQLLLSKRYNPTADRLRASAHHFANEVIQFLTMEPGICLTKIVFSRGAGDRRDLHCIDYDGENLLRMTANRTLNLFPAWSPDMNTIAFMSYREGQQGTYLLETHTGVVKLLGETVGSNLGPSWHPDGTELVLSLSKSGQHEIYRMNMQGKIKRRLTVSPAIEVSPSWSPNAQDIIFTSDRTGTPQLYIMDAEGGGRRRLTFEGRYNDSAEWSPNGEHIIYACREETYTQIVMVEAGGDNRRVLTDLTWRNCEDPSWAPDSRHIVFASDKTGVFKLYVLDTVEGAIRQLTFGDQPDTTPDWSN